MACQLQILVKLSLIILAAVIEPSDSADSTRKYCMQTNAVWSESTRSCFKYVKGPFTWKEADENCASTVGEGITGRLAVIPSYKVYNLVNSIKISASRNFWFGLRVIDSKNITQSNVKNGNFSHKHEWAYFRGNTIIEDFKWAPPFVVVDDSSVNEKLNKSSGDLCMRMATAGYKDASCDSSMAAICEFLEDIRTKLCGINGGNLSESTGTCFKYLEEKLSWDDADKKCTSLAPVGKIGRLAVIQNQTVYEFVRTVAPYKVDFWFGLRAKVKNPTKSTDHTGNFAYRNQWAFFHGDTEVASLKWSPITVAVDSNAACMQSNLFHGSYNDIKCTRRSSAVCEFVRDTSCQSISAHNPKDCSDILVASKDHKAKSGIYLIQTKNSSCPASGCCKWVYCDMETEGGGWTVLQRRKNGSVNFDKGMTEYKTGFGSPKGEHWLGLQAMSQITNRGTEYTLLVELKEFEQTCRLHAVYESFQVLVAPGYTLRLGDFVTGVAGDSLKNIDGVEAKQSGNLIIDGQNFTTKDFDNDKSSENCAATHKGGWWFNDCTAGNLNSEYYNNNGGCKQTNVADPANKYIVWSSARGCQYSFQETEMKIRPNALYARLLSDIFFSS